MRYHVVVRFADGAICHWLKLPEERLRELICDLFEHCYECESYLISLKLEVAK